MKSPEPNKFEGEVNYGGPSGMTGFKPGFLIIDKNTVNIWMKMFPRYPTVCKRCVKYKWISSKFKKPKDSVATFKFIDGRPFPRVIDNEARESALEVHFRADKSTVDTFSIALRTHLDEENVRYQSQRKVNVARPVNLVKLSNGLTICKYSPIKAVQPTATIDHRNSSFESEADDFLPDSSDDKSVSSTVIKRSLNESCDNQAKVHKANERDFSSPDDFSDVTFVVEGKKLHLSRVFLSTMSKKFKSMLTKDFGESKKVIAPIGPPGMELKYEQFMELMKVIHPPHADVNGHFYEIELIFKLADIFLAVRDKNHRLVPLIKKVAEIVTYDDKLHETKSLVYEEFKNVSVARELTKMPEFDALTSDMKATLLRISFDATE